MIFNLIIIQTLCTKCELILAMKKIYYSALFILSVGCSISSKLEKPLPALTFLDEYTIPYGFSFDSTPVGGLSGIDYDPVSGRYFSICDDRSDLAPARFYTYNIQFSNNKFDTIVFLKKTVLKDRSGQPYPSSAKGNKAGAVDPEALRWNSCKQHFIWTSEGERIVNNTDTILKNVAVTVIDTNGNYIDTFLLPSQLIMSYLEKGPRRNGGLEGFTFGKDCREVFVSVEEPLYNDGPGASTGDSSAVVRIIKYNVKSRKPLAQYAYEIDPVAHVPTPASAFKVNGISDILYLKNDRLLIIERSFSTGRTSCTIKLFIADLAGAGDISNLESLKNVSYKKLKKRLLFNMDDLGIFIDNIEGVTFGPKLPDGNQSLIFIADNNFNPLEKNQFLLFQISGL